MTVWAITGASGFIGMELARGVRSTGAEVRGLARRSTSQWIESGDICESEKLRRLVSGASVVVHLAGWVHKPARSKADVAECWRVNRDGTIALLDAVESDARDAFVVFVSTGAVYATSTLPLEETSPLAPRTPYAQSKLAAEQALLDRVRAGRVRGVVLRPGLVIGPGAPGNFGRMASMIRRRLFIRIDGGRQRKTIVPVSLLVDATLSVAASPQRFNGEILNVAAGEPLTILEIGNAIGEALGIRPVSLSLPGGLMAGLSRLFPPLRQLVETYSTDFVLDGRKLREAVNLRPLESRSAIGESIRPSR